MSRVYRTKEMTWLKAGGIAWMLAGMALLCTGCVSWTDDDRAELTSLETQIQDLYDGWEDGTITAEELTTGLDGARKRIERLQEKGYTIWEILLGLAGTFAAGALGVSRGGSWGRILGALGLDQPKKKK